MQNKEIAVCLFPASIKTIDGKKWGYINNKGRFVIPPQYEEAGEFQNNGLAIVWMNGLAGIISKSGRYLVKPKYSSINPFSDGVAIVFEEKKGYKLIDEMGIEQTKLAFELSFIGSFQEKMAVFQDKQFLYGYLDTSGNIIIPAQFEYAHDFHDGKAIVQLKDKISGLIGRTGKLLQTYPYEWMGPLKEGLIAFQKTLQDKSGYVNETGIIMIPPHFTIATAFKDDRAVVAVSENNQNRYGLIDKSGKFIISPHYYDIRLVGKDRVAVSKAIDPENPREGSVLAIADARTGQFLTDFIFDNVNNYHDGYASVIKGLYSFFIDLRGVPAKNLSIINGIGSLSIEGKLIRAFVDERVTYYDLHGNLVWKQNTVIPLTRTISIHEEKYRPHKDYLVYYPQIRGMKDKIAQLKLNEVLRNESRVIKISKYEKRQYSYSGDFSIHFFQKQLLVLELTGYEYAFGAAHGMPSKIYVHVDLKTGRIYHLKDLFLPGSDYVKVLGEIIGKQIKEQKEPYINYDDFKEIKENQAFYVSNEGLVIYFEPYEIVAFALGFPEFLIPYQELHSMINKNGEFWNSFH